MAGKDIIIVCAGGTAVEVYDLIAEINEDAIKNFGSPQYRVRGFLSDAPVDLGTIGIDEAILGPIHGWRPSGGEVYAMGNSTPSAKEALADLLQAQGAQFETLVSPFAFVTPGCEFGEGSVVFASSIVRRSKVGKFVNIQGSMLGRAEIGDYSTTTGYSNIAGSQLGKRVFVGSHAAIMNGKRVGDDALVCAGSIVFTNVKPATKVFGCPAKRMRELE